MSPAAPTSSPLPEPIPGWEMELVAEAPKITHPTVVACAPDGRIFVAEDPMDISLPKADAAAGRIVCLFPDGRMTVFAEKLYAVFGMQYLEGKLYVLHNPKFSVFDDDNGVGRNCRDLIEQTLPEPSALNWNDHVPANFRLGMDGCFYFASGDKGLHGAKGTDGSQAELFTGGIFCLRPDGTQLAVVSDGVRNILDVALNAEDEMFTYDNTDEHDWMGRFAHMVEGGFYGYPHDFIPQRPYTLWMMEDFGAGAACGVIANTEDALPLEFQGNVFLSDFGKRQIMRVRIEREGGTYRVVSKEDLFLNPPGDFRPVGIAPGPDGKSIYICDWQHLDDKEDVSVGRLFKLTWTGQDLSTPKPGWYVPAASGQPFAATTRELVSGLLHPSRSVRLTAQRRLTDRGATHELLALLRDTSAPALARTHALWALDAIDGGQVAHEDIMAASRDSDPILRRQSIRQLGAWQAKDTVRAVREGLKDLDPSVRFQAATALGRIGDPQSVSDLLSALEENDLFARYAAFTALHRIGTKTPSAWQTIVQGLTSNSARIREGTAYAVRETYDEQLLAALVALFKDNAKPSAVRRQALDLIASLHHRIPAWKGQWWAYHPALEPPPPKTETWPGTDTVLVTLRDGLRESDSDLRRACIEGLAIAHDTDSAPSLRGIFPHETDPVSRATILGTLGAMKDAGALGLITSELKQPSHPETTGAAIGAAQEIGGDQTIQALIGLLSSPNADATSLAQAIVALGALRAKSANAAIEPLTGHPAAAGRAASYRALGRLRGEAAVPTLERSLTDPSADVRHAVVQTLGDLKSNIAVPALLKAYADETVRADAFIELARTPDARAIDALLDGLSSRNPTERNAAHLAIQSIKDKVFRAVDEKAGLLSSQALTELRHIYAGNKQAEAGPIFAKQIKQYALEEYLVAAVKLSGDPERGRRLFAEPGGVNCIVCHRVAGQGNVIGPDLSSAGAQFDRRTLAEAILYPSKAVREGYQQVTIEMADDEVISGVVKGETADTLTLRDNAGAEHKVPRASI
ncbi:MAG: HEAT repeat domain-containing protein, partial [Chthoniobacteraceae bacterium]